MSDKVQLIKEEILRRKQSWQHSDKQYEHGGKDVCDYLLGFIDSLPEEPASEDLDFLVISLEETIGTSPHSREVIKEHLQKAAEWGRNHFEDKSEMVSEDLEEEFYRFIDEEESIPKMCNTRECIAWGVDIARNFAEWQKQKAFQDFMEKAEKFFKNELYVSISDEICSHNNFASVSNFIEQFKNYMQNEM